MLKSLRARAGRVAPNGVKDVGETADAQDAETSDPARVGSSPTSPRKNASIRGLRRTSTFKSISTLLLMASGPGATINVLRTSIMEMHERVQYRWVLHPMSGWKTLWDLISAMVVIFYSWMIPFMLCFDWYVMPHEMKIFLKVLDVWGFVDIALRFRTGIIEYGAVRMNPADIRKHYVRSIWFPIDIASTFPFEYFLTDPNNAGTRKTIKMIKYIKLPRLLRIGRFLKYVRKYKRYSSMVIALNALLFTSHVAGCIWVALLGPCDGDELYTEARCRPGMEMQMYWVAFHHGIVSLLGISANHIESAEQVLSGAYHKPQHLIASEIYVWGSVVSVLGATITASLYGTIINLVQSWNRAENAFRKKMDQITHEMDALSLPQHIRARVTAYYDYLWLNNRTFSDELNLLKDEGMSISLRQQIAIYLFKDHLQKVPFFQLATDAVLGMICMQLHQVIFMPDDFIIREGDIGRELFMIIKGIVQVMPVKKANPTEVKKILLGEGDFFGEIAVVMEVERTRSVKAECVSELCILSREGFDKILVEFPEFATAMKRLIIKRVGEMYNTDNKENTIEKMTLLADYQMKKKIATYNNVKKLRSTAKAIQTIVPRLSKVVKDPVPAEVLGMKETELAELRSRSSAAVTIVSVNTAAEQDSAPELEVIREWDQESEGSHTSQRNSRTLSADNIPIRLGSGPQNEIKPSLDSLAYIPPVRVKNPLVGSSTGTAPLDTERDQSGRIEYVEARLMALEKKFDGHMHNVDAKIGQILDALGSLLNRSPTRAGPTTQVIGQTAKPRSRPASPHRDLPSQAVRSPSPTRDLATQARGLAIRVDSSNTSAGIISSTGMTQSSPVAAKAPVRSTEPSREFLNLGEESKQV